MVLHTSTASPPNHTASFSTWPRDCEYDDEIRNAPPLKDDLLSNGFLCILRNTEVIKFPNASKMLRREFDMAVRAGDCSVAILGRVFSNGEFKGYFMPLERPVKLDGVGLERRIEMMDQLVSLVQDLHSKNIVHGDINISNVLECSDGKLRLCDFGSAALEEEGYIPALTTTIGCCQDMMYRERPWTKADDLYALGTTLYHIITGHCAFPEAKNEIEMEDMIKDGALPDLSVITDDRARRVIAEHIDAAPKWDGVEPVFVPLTEEQKRRNLEILRELYPNVPAGSWNISLTQAPEQIETQMDRAVEVS